MNKVSWICNKRNCYEFDAYESRQDAMARRKRRVNIPQTEI